LIILWNYCSEKNKSNKDEANGNADESLKETKATPSKTTDKKPATPTKSAAASKQETPVAKKSTPKATSTKASRPGPASTKRQLSVNLKRTSAAAIKAATKPAADSKWERAVHKSHYAYTYIHIDKSTNRKPVIWLQQF